jgi:hypothetical protein
MGNSEINFYDKILQISVLFEMFQSIAVTKKNRILEMVGMLSTNFLILMLLPTAMRLRYLYKWFNFANSFATIPTTLIQFHYKTMTIFYVTHRT